MQHSFLSGLRERKHFVLLLTLVLTIVVQPLARGFLAGVIIYDVMRTLVVFIVFFIVFQRGRDRHISLLIGFPVLVGGWAPHLLPERFETVLAVIHHGFLVAFLGAAVAMILRDIFERQVVRADDVIGTICGYLLAGIVWANLFLLVELFIPGSFSVPQKITAQLANRYGRQALFADYSFITLTSLGSGDIVPSSPPATSLTWLEAMFGQFYIAVIVAQLVGLRLAQTLQQGGPKAEQGQDISAQHDKPDG
jgi:voltage-gated potassium channel